MSHELVKGEYTSSTPITLQVMLGRDTDEDGEEDDDQRVVAPFYPGRKMANWWLVVGEPGTRLLHAIKRVTVKKSFSAKLEFTLPPGTHTLKLYIICDSYNGADHDITLGAIEVAEGEESDSDEDDSDDVMEE